MAPHPTTYVAKMQTLFEVPVTLYYFKPDQVYLEKWFRIRVYGFKLGEKVLAGELKVDLAKMAESGKSRFDPMQELTDEYGKPCGIFLSIELALNSAAERGIASEKNARALSPSLNQTPSLSSSPARNYKQMSPRTGSSEQGPKTITFAPIKSGGALPQNIVNSSNCTCLLNSN